MTRDFDVIVEHDSEGYYVASVPRYAGYRTRARSLDELMERAREAKSFASRPMTLADVVTLAFVGVQRLTVTARVDFRPSGERTFLSKAARASTSPPPVPVARVLAAGPPPLEPECRPFRRMQLASARAGESRWRGWLPQRNLSPSRA